MRFKKSTFLVPKGPLLGVPHFPRLDPGYGHADFGPVIVCLFSMNGSR